MISTGPPSAGTPLRSPPSQPKTIRSSGPHSAPIGFGTSVSVTGPCPSSETLRTSLSAKKPTHRPSGEKNGLYAPSVPGSATTS